MQNLIPNAHTVLWVVSQPACNAVTVCYVLAAKQCCFHLVSVLLRKSQ